MRLVVSRAAATTTGRFLVLREPALRTARLLDSRVSRCQPGLRMDGVQGRRREPQRLSETRKEPPMITRHNQPCLGARSPPDAPILAPRTARHVGA
jgi:hypothetical protein